MGVVETVVGVVIAAAVTAIVLLFSSYPLIEILVKILILWEFNIA